MSKSNHLDITSLINQTQVRTKEKMPTSIDPYTARIDRNSVIINIDDLYDAPKEWNKFPSIRETSEDKYLQVKMSIASSGVFSPLIVWEYSEKEFKQDNSYQGRYMILAGHNRCHILRELCEEYPEEKEKYQTVACKVYRRDEINEIKAKEIINDSNYLQREKVPNRILLEIINDRMEYAAQQKTPKGETIQELADKLNLKKTAIYENLQIKDRLIDELKQLYFSEKLKKKGALALAKLPTSTQHWLVGKFDITNEKAIRVKPTMTKEDLTILFSQQEDKALVKIVSVEVPVQYERELKMLIAEWKKAKGL